MSELGWNGLYCDKQCTAGTWGVGCVSKCDCRNEGICDPQNGRCSCRPGTHGSKCEMTCSAMTFGLECQQNCSCVRDNTQKCDAANGACICRQRWQGIQFSTISTVLWQCFVSIDSNLCPFLGAECDTSCEDGKWGENCNRDCRCNGASCEQTTGTCHCPPGTTGNNCDQPCSQGTFGLNCGPSYVP